MKAAHVYGLAAFLLAFAAVAQPARGQVYVPPVSKPECVPIQGHPCPGATSSPGGTPGGLSTNSAVRNEMVSGIFSSFLGMLFSSDSKAEEQKRKMMQELAKRQAAAGMAHRAEEATRIEGLCRQLEAALKLSGAPELKLKEQGESATDLRLKLSITPPPTDPRAMTPGQLADLALRIQIGKTAAVQGTGYWLTSDGRKVPIVEDGPVFHGARLVTDPGARIQFGFLDGTELTISGKVDLVVDDFIYDPEHESRGMDLAVRQGTIRWLSGAALKKWASKFNVRTPSASLAIRGTEFELSYHPGEPGHILLYSGELELTDAQTGAVFPLRAGQMVGFRRDGTLSGPVPLSAR